MAKRKVRKKKAVKRKVRKTTRRKKVTVRVSPKENVSANKKAHWAAYRELHDQIHRTLNQFKTDAKKGAYPELMEDHKRLLLLMGECNYMLNECIRLRDNR